MTDQFAHPDHEEIAALANRILEPDLAYAPSLAPQLHAASGNPGRELFVNVFVAQALQGVDSLLARDKEYIAQRAAAFAAQGVDVLRAAIVDIKVQLGIK